PSALPPTTTSTTTASRSRRSAGRPHHELPLSSSSPRILADRPAATVTAAQDRDARHARRDVDSGGGRRTMTGAVAHSEARCPLKAETRVGIPFGIQTICAPIPDRFGSIERSRALSTGAGGFLTLAYGPSAGTAAGPVRN